MTYRARRQLTAWLGLIAMCLVAFAPTVSHFVRAARTVVLPVCTVEGEQAARPVNLLIGSMTPMRAGAMTAMTAMAAVMTMGDMPSMHHAPSAGHGADGHADHESQPMDDCGYCDLLNHVPALAMVPPAPVAALLLLFAVFLLPALRRYTPLGAFPSGRPRAPPAFS
ncbi:hypothetical protein CAL12_07765 [Bordetella genomosp. 8]|uniref:DUF2946 domain-containing protein n=1 Tax=Bordetella genomosp. 8 TaxID=1416806 RepID=A0A1W6YJM0_9BORD|nr:DUF2946 domain-containing protein [Bordetella genomosp. 8]ARP80743.1 hypothetical protein CAL12_07765 [Bordetella genomosp. 8]